MRSTQRKVSVLSLVSECDMLDCSARNSSLVGDYSIFNYNVVCLNYSIVLAEISRDFLHTF